MVEFVVVFVVVLGLVVVSWAGRTRHLTAGTTGTTMAGGAAAVAVPTTTDTSRSMASASRLVCDTIVLILCVYVYVLLFKEMWTKRVCFRTYRLNACLCSAGMPVIGWFQIDGRLGRSTIGRVLGRCCQPVSAVIQPAWRESLVLSGPDASIASLVGWLALLSYSLLLFDTLDAIGFHSHWPDQ